METILKWGVWHWDGSVVYAAKRSSNVKPLGTSLIPMRNKEDLSGLRFGRLQAIRPYRSTNPMKYTPPQWECICDCGKLTYPETRKLVAGKVLSCGCYKRDKTGDRARTHGLSKTPEYRIWNQMKQRCTNPNRKSYKNYGSRGINVCTAWLASFESFLHDMGKRPSPKHTLERLNNEDGYNPCNCVWATKNVQANNTRRVRRYTLLGETLTMKQWCDRLHLNYWTVRTRLDTGVPPDVAFEVVKQLEEMK